MRGSGFEQRPVYGGGAIGGGGSYGGAPYAGRPYASQGYSEGNYGGGAIAGPRGYERWRDDESELRNGITGVLYKEGRRLRIPVKRSFSLKENQLSCRKVTDASICWEVNIANCEVTRVQQKKIVLNLPFRLLTLHASDEGERDKWAEALIRAAASDISMFYQVGTVIGRGCFGEVRKGFQTHTHNSAAIKIIKKSNCTIEDLDYFEREVNIVKDLRHENIVQTFDIFDTEHSLYLCMEYMEGGMLYDNISECGYFTEKIASKIFGDILRGVAYLHKNGIAHRDIKPENILCTRSQWPYRVKLSDFGLSNYSSMPMQTRVGTPYFVAPEVLKGESYGCAVDLWSCGVVLFNLLSGKLPFDSHLNQPEKIFRKIIKGQFSFPDSEWSEISEEAKDLIRGLLVVDSRNRLTAEEALASPWVDSPRLSEVNIANDRSTLHSSIRSLPSVVRHSLDLGSDSNVSLVT